MPYYDYADEARDARGAEMREARREELREEYPDESEEEIENRLVDEEHECCCNDPWCPCG
tara:strand:+ start:322 stop:501 length:180 start_codon:yes stop_codon:yes gene_type:complete